MSVGGLFCAGRLIKIAVFVVVVLADQLTKHVAVANLNLGRPVEVIPGIFNFTLVYNPGAAFGLFQGLPDSIRHLALGVTTVLAVVVIIVLYLKDLKHDRVSLIALTGILGAAVGNLIDRFRFDAVVDFLDFYWGDYHWPAFNIADSVISVGVFIVLLRMMFVHPPEGEIGERVLE